MSGKYYGTHDFSNATVVGIDTGGASMFDCTVGASGADYTTLGAAITAGKVKILVIDNTTETGNITMPSNLIVYGIGMYNKAINMGTYALDPSTNSNFMFKNIKIISSRSSGNMISTPSGLVLENVYIDGSGSTGGGILFSDSPTNPTAIYNLHIKCRNASTTMLNINGTAADILIDGLTIQGNGSSTAGCAYLGGNIKNLNITGTFSSGANIIDMRGIIDGVNQDSTDAYQYNIVGQSYYSDIVNNFRVPNATLTLVGDIILNNFITSTINATSDRLTITNGWIKSTSSSALVVNSGADESIISNIRSLGGFSVTGNDITISACKIGANGGGGSNTITINSGSTRTIISDCRVDADISDSGTDTSASYVVY